MDQMYVAACSLDGKVIRLVFLGASTLEQAKAEFARFGQVHPRATIAFGAMAADLGTTMGLTSGGAVEWWRRDELAPET